MRSGCAYEFYAVSPPISPNPPRRSAACARVDWRPAQRKRPLPPGRRCSSARSPSAPTTAVAARSAPPRRGPPRPDWPARSASILNPVADVNGHHYLLLISGHDFDMGMEAAATQSDLKWSRRRDAFFVTGSGVVRSPRGLVWWGVRRQLHHERIGRVDHPRCRTPAQPYGLPTGSPLVSGAGGPGVRAAGRGGDEVCRKEQAFPRRR